MKIKHYYSLSHNCLLKRRLTPYFDFDRLMFQFDHLIPRFDFLIPRFDHLMPI